MKTLYLIFVFTLLASCSRPLLDSKPLETMYHFQNGERFYTVNGIRHWVKVKGSEHKTTPIVVVHGGPGGNNYNFEQSPGPKLEKFATVIYYEQRGSGRSDAPADPKDYRL